MRTNIDIEDSIIKEAFAVTGLRTKKELVHLALKELILKHKKKDLFELGGAISFNDDFDYKNMRELRRL